MGEHTTQHFELHIGDSKLLTITVKDTAGVIVDITSAAEIRFRVSGDQLDTVMDISKNLTDDSAGDVQISNGAAGEFTVKLNPVDTASLPFGIYFWKSKITDSVADVSTVTTGYINLLPSLV